MATYYIRIYGLGLSKNIYLLKATSSTGTYSNVGNLGTTSKTSYLTTSTTTSGGKLYFRLSTSSTSVSSSSTSYIPLEIISDVTTTGTTLGARTNNYKFYVNAGTSANSYVYFTLSIVYPIYIYGLGGGKVAYLLQRTSLNSSYTNTGNIGTLSTTSMLKDEDYSSNATTHYYTLSGSSSSVTYTPYSILSISGVGTKIDDKNFSVTFPTTDTKTTINLAFMYVTPLFNEDYNDGGVWQNTSTLYAGKTDGAKTVNLTAYDILYFDKAKPDSMDIYITGSNNKPGIVNYASTTNGNISYSGNKITLTGVTANPTVYIKADGDSTDTGGVYYGSSKKGTGFFGSIELTGIYWGNTKLAPFIRDWDYYIQQTIAQPVIATYNDMVYVVADICSFYSQGGVGLIYWKDSDTPAACVNVIASDPPSGLSGWTYVDSVPVSESINPADLMGALNETIIYLIVPEDKENYTVYYRSLS